MAGWNNRNCCCEPKTYTCADGEIDICCLTLELTTWSRALTAYSVRSTPDDVCGYTVLPYPSNNFCGYVLGLNTCLTLPHFEIRWGVQPDGTVKLVLDIFSTVDGNGDYVGPVHHEITGLDPDTWYLSPLTFTLSGVTYTIAVCPDPHEPFPEWPLSTVYLKAAATAQTHETRSLGNLVCGNPCDPFGSFVNYVYLSWRYNVYSDEITLSFGGSLGNGSLSVPYDNGNWVNGTHTIPVSAYIGPDFSVTVTAVDTCTIPPPPSVCEWESACWPDLCPCLVDGSADPPVLYRTIYADVSGAVTATGLALAPNNGTQSFNYNSGSDYIVIQCTNGGMDPYYVAAQFSGVTYFFSIPANGLACTEDGLQMVDETVTDGTVTIRFYTL